MTGIQSKPITHSHQSGTCRIQSCVLCDVQRGGHDNFTSMSGESPELSLSNLSPELTVMMDSFPIGELGGHLLIVPRKHFASLAQYPDKKDLASVVDQTTRTLQEVFPDYWQFTFEHGPGEIDLQQVKCGGCHVDHAHGHIVLVDRSVSFEDIRDLVELTLEDLGWDLDEATLESAQPFVDMADFAGRLPYLQIGRIDDGQREAVTFRQTQADKAIPSQLLRKLVSKASGRPSTLAWNWKIALKQNIQQRLDRYRDEGVWFKTKVEQHIAASNLQFVA